MKRICAVVVVALVLAGCNAAPSDVGGGKLAATDCRSHISVGDQMRLSVQWTAPKVAKYTLLRLDGARNFTVESIFDQTLSQAQSNGVSGEYDLPGPRSVRSKKTIVVLLTARRSGNSAFTVSVWGSGDAITALPDNAAAVSCSVVVSP